MAKQLLEDPNVDVFVDDDIDEQGNLPEQPEQDE
jgi:hypothetical protein